MLKPGQEVVLPHERVDLGEFQSLLRSHGDFAVVKMGTNIDCRDPAGFIVNMCNKRNFLFVENLE